MSIDRDLDQQLARWFDQQTTAPSPDLLPRAIARLGRVPQRPGFLTRDWYGTSGAIPGGRMVAPAVVVVLLLVAAVTVLATSGILVLPRPPVVTTTQAIFAPSTEVAFRAAFGTGSAGPLFKWRAGAYSEYSGTGWSWGLDVRVPVAAAQPLDAFEDQKDRNAATGWLPVEMTVIPEAHDGPTIVGPAVIRSVDVPLQAITVSGGRWLAALERSEGAEPYTVSAFVQVPGLEPGGLNEATMRGAGRQYPAEIVSTYLPLPDGAMGRQSTALLEEIRSAVPRGQDAGNPYDLARTIETYLANDANFAYSADVRAEVETTCQSISTAECFATIRRGYCEYYATTMAVLLRASGIPARIVYGFLPGERENGVEVVGGWLAHWWVEAYFPGFGWLEFDPTGGSVGQSQPLPPGA